MTVNAALENIEVTAAETVQFTFGHKYNKLFPYFKFEKNSEKTSNLHLNSFKSLVHDQKVVCFVCLKDFESFKQTKLNNLLIISLWVHDHLIMGCVLMESCRSANLVLPALTETLGTK